MIKGSVIVFGQSSAELSALRSSAAHYSTQHGLPNRRLENWKYTDLRRLLAGHAFESVIAESNVAKMAKTVDGYYVAAMINGHAVVTTMHLPDGVTVTSMTQAFA